MQFTYLTSFVTVFTTSSFFLFLLSPFLLFSFFVCKHGNKNVHFMLTTRVLTFFLTFYFFFEFLIPIQLDLNSILDPTKSFTKPSKLFRQKNEILHFLGRKMKFNVNSQLNIRNKAVKLIYKLSK